MAQETDFQPLVSVVNYDITSSEDELGEIESANGQAFVYASSRLPAPRLPPEISGQCDSSTESESDSEEEADTNPYNTEPEASPLPLLPASTKVEKPQDQRAACRPLGISSSDEESASVRPSPKKIKAEIVSISSSSSEHEEDPAVGEVAANKRRRAYALKMAELPAQMRRFLAASRSFHTRPHSLERSTPAVAPSTYDKAEERLLCKYFWSFVFCCFFLVCLFVWFFFFLTVCLSFLVRFPRSRERQSTRAGTNAGHFRGFPTD